MSLPLAGLKVIDLSMNAPGPMATMMLADFGADVVHVIRPGMTALGDIYCGDVGDDPYVASRFRPYDAVMRNKRSLALDLKDARGREVLMKLAADADVFVEEFRPGKMAKLGLGYDALSAVNPRLIYCSLTGYGQRGPLADAAGHDLTYLAMTGALDMIRGRDDQPVNPQNILSDNGGASMSAVAGILMALYHRERTGRGQHVDANCTDSVIYLMADLFSTALGGGHPSDSWRETFLGRMPHYRTYRCRDGTSLAVGALERHFGASFFAALGRPELMNLLDDRSRWPELTAILEDLFAQDDRDVWIERFVDPDCCVTPVLSLEQVAGHANTQARGMIRDVFGVTQVGIAPVLSESPGFIRSAPALPGAHSDEVLRDLGFDEATIDTLREDGVTA